MLGYFIKASKAESGEVFAKYVWAFRNLFYKKIEITKYSEDLNLLLIEYTVEGKFIDYPKKDFRYISYRVKEKSSAIEVGVKKEFIDWSDKEKKDFIISTTIKSIDIVEHKLIKKGLDVDGFLLLLVDLNDCIEEYKSLKIE